MKNQKQKKKLIKELEIFGNILNSCKKSDIATSTYYRWINIDPEFKKQAEEAIEVGRKNMTDFAEGALYKNVQNGNQRAIEYALGHNSERYRNRNETNVSITHSRNNPDPVVTKGLTLEDLLDRDDQEVAKAQAEWDAKHKKEDNKPR